MLTGNGHATGIVPLQTVGSVVSYIVLRRQCLTGLLLNSLLLNFSFYVTILLLRS